MGVEAENVFRQQRDERSPALRKLPLRRRALLAHQIGIFLSINVAMMGEVAAAVRPRGDEERPREEQLRHDGIQAAVLEEHVMRAFVHENGQRVLSGANPHDDDREEDRMQESLIQDDGQDDGRSIPPRSRQCFQRVERRELPDDRRRETRGNVPGVGIRLRRTDVCCPETESAIAMLAIVDDPTLSGFLVSTACLRQRLIATPADSLCTL